MELVVDPDALIKLTRCGAKEAVLAAVMEVIPVCLQDDLSRAVVRVAAREGLNRSAAMRRALAAGLNGYVAPLFRDGQISTRKAAAWLGVTLREAVDRMEQAGVGGDVARADVREAVRSLRPEPNGRPV